MIDQISIVQTHPKHMGLLDSPYAGSGKNILALEVTRTILSRMVQGWRNLINTR
ncbi:MAG: hypothetical protein LBU82_05075 [Treponema sp.]|jgi:hypothetical protein|nr:hypothetical protein [Treponema sp.]